ncbi:InlB B-repeat-containing protein [Paenibacillus sp. FSL K6-3182]|uniref:InlB B-repeat-containing protein n=1 Tax=Paenibacillus sp. FSL K6-3182 TaxID=2921495 RepID=UPI0030CC8647
MIAISGDGASWTNHVVDELHHYSGASYGNGTYVAVGIGGKIVTSSDGASWASRSSGTANHLYGVAYGDGTYVALGTNGTILQSGSLTPKTYTLTYKGNGSTGGTEPTDSHSYAQGETVTVLGNTGSLAKTGNTFAGWNTAANGSGTGYATGATFSMGAANVTLYAQWTAIPSGGNTGGGGGGNSGSGCRRHTPR